MAEYVLEAENLHYFYPDNTPALQGVCLKIKKGQKVAILGSNGAGKTTLFLHLNGILKPHKGKVYFNGREIKYDKRSLLQLRSKVGVVFQDPDTQLFSASVYQEISFGPMNLGLEEEAVRKRVHRAMEETGVISLKDKATHFLSYGQKKRVSIADVLAMEPEVLICDEPNAWLDPKHSKQIKQLFNETNKNGTTVIMSTHDVELAYSWADYVFILHCGKVIGEGVPQEVFQDDILVEKASLEKPWLIDITNVLIQKGILDSNISYPREKRDLIRLISGNISNRGGEDCDLGIIGNKGRERNWVSID